MTARRRSAQALGIALDGAGDDRALFKWLLANFLFGKRVQQSVAERHHVRHDET